MVFGATRRLDVHTAACCSRPTGLRCDFAKDVVVIMVTIFNL